MAGALLNKPAAAVRPAPATFWPTALKIVRGEAEFGLEYDSRIESDRRYHLLKLLAKLKEAGVPLDGIGLLASPRSLEGRSFGRRAGTLPEGDRDLGLFIVISELDVKEQQYILPVAERDERVADETKRYLEIVLARPAVRGLTTWGLSDRHSWLEVTQDDLARYPDAWKEARRRG